MHPRIAYSADANERALNGVGLAVRHDQCCECEAEPAGMSGGALPGSLNVALKTSSRRQAGRIVGDIRRDSIALPVRVRVNVRVQLGLNDCARAQ